MKSAETARFFVWAETLARAAAARTLARRSEPAADDFARPSLFFKNKSHKGLAAFARRLVLLWQPHCFSSL
jgi:hypothetical protein